MTCNNCSISFLSLYFMLFYKVKIERAIKGNSNLVTGQWPTILWPLTVICSLVIFLEHLDLEQQPISVLKLHCAISDSGDHKLQILLWDDLHNPETMLSYISYVPLNELQDIMGKEAVKKHFHNRLYWLSFFFVLSLYINICISTSNSPPSEYPDVFECCHHIIVFMGKQN